MDIRLLDMGLASLHLSNTLIDMSLSVQHQRKQSALSDTRDNVYKKGVMHTVVTFTMNTRRVRVLGNGKNRVINQSQRLIPPHLFE